MGTDLVEIMGFGQINFQLISGLSRVGHHKATKNHSIAGRKELIEGGRKERTIPFGNMPRHFSSVTEPASFISPRKVGKGPLEEVCSVLLLTAEPASQLEL